MPKNKRVKHMVTPKNKQVILSYANLILAKASDLHDKAKREDSIDLMIKSDIMYNRANQLLEELFEVTTYHEN